MRNRSAFTLIEMLTVIVIVAVFMSVFLVGCLWYLVGVGDAAIYREKMQDASDATAFASAVYHARGMNIIAMLNLIMAAALAVRAVGAVGPHCGRAPPPWRCSLSWCCCWACWRDGKLPGIGLPPSPSIS